ncbi:MAG: helix-turn-helix domain-containing protein [Gammaproteobacteria bacterium]|nr:helix-turn-helix domain-containing protein [Gammaproteobacteria bacterium]
MADNEVPRPAQATPALGLGERLRSARKARALSVLQVADALHLEEPMVLALEEERFEQLGAPVFVRGHLRRYAQLVGLAPDAVLEAYRAAAPESMLPPLLVRPRAEMPGQRMGSWPLWLLAAVLAIGLLVALGGGNRRGAAPPAAGDAPAATMAPPSIAPSSMLLPEQEEAADSAARPLPGDAPADSAEVDE